MPKRQCLRESITSRQQRFIASDRFFFFWKRSRRIREASLPLALFHFPPTTRPAGCRPSFGCLPMVLAAWHQSTCIPLFFESYTTPQFPAWRIDPILSDLPPPPLQLMRMRKLTDRPSACSYHDTCIECASDPTHPKPVPKLEVCVAEPSSCIAQNYPADAMS